MEQCLYDVWLIQLGLGHVVGSCLSAPVISIWSCPPYQDRNRQQTLGYITDPWLRHAGRSLQFPDLAIPCLESMFAAALLGCATTDLRQNGCDTNAAGVSPIITAFLAKVPGGPHHLDATFPETKSRLQGWVHHQHTLHEARRKIWQRKDAAKLPSLINFPAFPHQKVPRLPSTLRIDTSRRNPDNAIRKQHETRHV